VLALGFGGLPLTGGGLAKLEVKGPLGEGVVGHLATLAAAGSTLLMLHFLHRLRSSASSDPRAGAPPGLVWPWLGVAFEAVAVPWTLFLTTGIGTMADVLAPSALWELLWPVLLGVVLAAGLRHFGHRLPPVPEGDVVALGGRAVRMGRAFGDWLVRAEGVLRQWPAAGVSLLTLALLLGAVLLVQVSQAPP
jgi:hypothetical protein